MKRFSFNCIYILAFIVSLTGVSTNAIDLTLGMPESSDVVFLLCGRFRPEAFWGKNINLLNSNVREDRSIFWRHTFDITTDVKYGQKTFGDDLVICHATIRNKGIWGNTESIARTTAAEVKPVNAVVGRHSHSIPRHVLWIRELWLECAMDALFNLGFLNCHTLTVGSFPFQLGRGISLGDAYLVGPENLGFYAESIIDQYAFGAKLSGELAEECLSYDLYAGILNNRSASFAETGSKTQMQEFGRRFNPERGYGKINYVVAGRLQWNVLSKSRSDKLTIEPYALFNDDREQQVEFLGDAASKLGTVGLALEYIGKTWEAGFDTAVNIGYQKVRGWDRNVVNLENRGGVLVEVNSHVVAQNGLKVPFAKGAAQTTIESSYQNETENGKTIGQTNQAFLVDALNNEPLDGTTELINAKNRFRNPYNNKLQGWMAVADIGYWMCDRNIFWAIAGGVASGDTNPNSETIDGNYKGFIGLQEVYSGTRVRSAFLMSGAGKVKRPLSVPKSNQAPSAFAFEVSGFSNLVFGGTSLCWKPKHWDRKFNLNPNLLVYGQQFATKKFDAILGKDLYVDASNFLGVELNVFIDYNPIKDVKWFFVGSVFFPGQHYKDIKGKPLNSGQEAILSRAVRNGEAVDPLPNIGHNVAITLNAGLEYRF
ncbi:MAG TPA: hypothetical protein VGT41_04455 [Candidatus Babeliales bacterium]|nr:hypothetical protein [Candidatus Babeliales bacterium]